jgi:serine/threonine protein kinase
LDELQVGDPRQVGNYTLLARLGAGGMGQVYFGRSLGGRHVAVKVIRADLAQDQSFRARFAREVEAARRVSGAFTAPVIDADPDAPIPWLVTDYVHGPSLGDAVARHGSLPLPAVLTLAARLAEGLSAVHAAGVIHRDLKPANVLLAEDGPRLIDFGISQAADFVQITSPTTVLGTPGFIAPELIQGDPVGPSSDIFTMGAVLAYAATGELPFGAGPADARTLRVLYLAPGLDNVPGELRPLLERCLAKDPTERPTADEFLADLIAARPDAAEDRANWLPEDVLAEIRQRPLPEAELATSHLRVTAPPQAMAPAPTGGRPSWQQTLSQRRRIWAGGTAAVVMAVIGILIGLLAAPSGDPLPQTKSGASLGQTNPRFPSPTGLFAVLDSATAVTLGWNAYPGGSEPDQFEILENNEKIATVPGDQVSYEVTGLSTSTAYLFNVAAVTGASHSASSVPVTAITGSGPATPPAMLQVAEAAFNLTSMVDTKVTFSSDDYWNVGDSWSESWAITSDCGRKPCDARINGNIDGVGFTVDLIRSGATYIGSGAVDNYWDTCGSTSDYQEATVSIKLTANSARMAHGQWSITGFAGTVAWDVLALPGGCPPSLYQMQVRGGAS